MVNGTLTQCGNSDELAESLLPLGACQSDDLIVHVVFHALNRREGGKIVVLSLIPKCPACLIPCSFHHGAQHFLQGDKDVCRSDRFGEWDLGVSAMLDVDQSHLFSASACVEEVL